MNEWMSCYARLCRALLGCAVICYVYSQSLGCLLRSNVLAIRWSIRRGASYWSRVFLINPTLILKHSIKAYVERIRKAAIVLYLSISIALLTAWAFQKRSRSQQLTLCRSLHAEALQATVSEGLAQGPYVAVRFEPTTLRSKGIDPTNAPPYHSSEYGFSWSTVLNLPSSVLLKYRAAPGIAAADENQLPVRKCVHTSSA